MLHTTLFHSVLITTSLAVAASFVVVPKAFAVESTPTMDSKCQVNSNSNAKTIQTNALTPKVDSVQLQVNRTDTEKDTKNNVVNISKDEKAQKINDAICVLRNLFLD
ncbi:MAG: hypothetical protein LH649_14765 [Pseudanabaena sp. CAN_BIN31]|nr:hypothetical protein [Pseudanabaena sp. CAN_BIN31]